MAEERPRTFRWTMLLRLIAMILVQLAIGRWLLTVWFLKEKGYLSAQWFSTLDGLTVTFAAVVADICLCGIILLLGRSNIELVAFEIFTSVVVGFVWLCLTPVPRPGTIEFRIVAGGFFVGWLIGCLLARPLRARATSAQKPKLQFTLREIFIAMLIAAIGAWLISTAM